MQVYQRYGRVGNHISGRRRSLVIEEKPQAVVTIDTVKMVALAQHEVAFDALCWDTLTQLMQMHHGCWGSQSPVPITSNV